MTDTVDQPQVDENPAEDLNDDVVSRLEKAMDSRFSGFQSILDKNIATVRTEFASQLEEVRRSGMSPEELEDLQETEKERELTRLRKEVELLRMRKDHPEEVDFLSQFVNAETFNEQLQLLSKFRSAQSQSGPTPREEPVDDESDNVPVDRNNPSRKAADSIAAIIRNGGEMTREQAAKLLGSLNERGAIARIRKEQ